MAKHTIPATHTHTHSQSNTGCPRFLMGSDWSAADTQTAPVSQTWKSEGRRMEECQGENTGLSCGQPSVSNLQKVFISLQLCVITPQLALLPVWQCRESTLFQHEVVDDIMVTDWELVHPHHTPKNRFSHLTLVVFSHAHNFSFVILYLCDL